MSDTYHYEDGAIHNDHKRVLHIDSVGSGDVGKLISAFFKDDAKEAEVMEEVERADIQSAEGLGRDTTLSASKQSILDLLLDFADKGDWIGGISTADVKAMLKIVLGQGDTPLSGKEVEQSAKLWQLLENGRGDRVKIVWQNLVGYLDDKKLFRQKGSPALNKDFFDSEEGYSNIDKGRPSRDNMSSGFRDILPLLDAYVPIE